MLGAGCAQQLQALAIEENDRAQVDVELKIDVLGLMLGGRRADSGAGVVDEHVEAPETLAVSPDDLADPVLVGHVRRYVLHFIALVAKLGGRLLEPVRLARGERHAIALLGEGLGERQAYASRGSGDDGGAVGHTVDLSDVSVGARNLTGSRIRVGSSPAGRPARRCTGGAPPCTC